MFIGLVGEVGAFVKVEVIMVGLVADVSTFNGASAAAFGGAGSTEGLMIPIDVVDTVGAELCWDKSGWIPTEGAALKMGTLAVEANERTGVAGNATLNLGSGSAAVKLAGGERLSGEARGGVSGAYGAAETVGTVTIVGTCVGCETLDIPICALAATAALIASSLWARKFSRWLSKRTWCGSFMSTPSTLVM